jgi:chromosome segregation ATPase
MADLQDTQDKKQPSPKSFRVDDETASKIKDIANQIGGNQQAAFSALIDAYEFEQGKAAIPDRAEEIEVFHSKLHDAEEIYKKALEQYRDQDAVIHSQYDAQLRSKDTTIQQLQESMEKLKAEIETLKADLDIAKKDAEDAEDRKKNAEALAQQAKDAADAAKGQVQDKQDIIDRISRDLKAADEKSAQYNDLKALYEAAIHQKEKAEQAIIDTKRDAEEAAKDAKRAAEIELDKAVLKANESGRIALEKMRKELENTISNLKDQLREAISSAEMAKKDSENAKYTAIAELSNTHTKEMEELHARLDQRTEELMKAKEKIVELKSALSSK